MQDKLKEAGEYHGFFTDNQEDWIKPGDWYMMRDGKLERVWEHKPIFDDCKPVTATVEPFTAHFYTIKDD